MTQRWLSQIIEFSLAALGQVGTVQFLPEEDTLLKEMSQESVIFWLSQEPITAQQQQDGTGGQWTHAPTYMHTHMQACIHKCIHTYAAENPHILILTPSPLLQKADAIYMSWREVTGSNQPGE